MTGSVNLNSSTIPLSFWHTGLSGNPRVTYAMERGGQQPPTEHHATGALNATPSTSVGAGVRGRSVGP